MLIHFVIVRKIIIIQTILNPEPTANRAIYNSTIGSILLVSIDVLIMLNMIHKITELKIKNIDKNVYNPCFSASL
jgi:hypothetical protein